jgi:hypothetical protein
MFDSVQFLFQISHIIFVFILLYKGGADMKRLFSSRSKKLQAIGSVSALLLGFTGMAHAQSQNPKGENPQKPVVTEEKPANNPDAMSGERKKGKKQSKQESSKDSANYKGAQPPQGGRLGQGPDHPD